MTKTAFSLGVRLLYTSAIVAKPFLSSVSAVDVNAADDEISAGLCKSEVELDAKKLAEDVGRMSDEVFAGVMYEPDDAPATSDDVLLCIFSGCSTVLEDCGSAFCAEEFAQTSLKIESTSRLLFGLFAESSQAVTPNKVNVSPAKIEGIYVANLHLIYEPHW